MKVCFEFRTLSVLRFNHLLLPFLVRVDWIAEVHSSKQLAKRLKDPHQEKKWGEKHVMLQRVHRVHWVEWFSIHAVSIWTWTGSTTTGHGRGQLCHLAPLKPPQGATGVLGFSVLGCLTSSDRKASYWPGFLLGHHEWLWTSSSHEQRLSKATPVTPALVTAQRTSLLQSYPAALTSADPLRWWVYLHWSLVRW